jgi:hypothetical protein
MSQEFLVLLLWGGRGYSARGAILLEIGKCSTAQLVCADDMFRCHCDAVYSCDSIRSFFAALKLSF